MTTTASSKMSSRDLLGLQDRIDPNRLPQHVAIIMDGNGRWARLQGQPRTFGHRQGVTAVREATEGAAELGIKYLTLFAFSTENWTRPKFEVDALMRLLLQTISKEVKTLNKNNIRLNAVGNLGKLPDKIHQQLIKAIESTSDNSRMTLTLALSYSSRWEIVEAARMMAAEVKNGLISVDQITDEKFSEKLAMSPIPDPELLIRTSGEYRISNFLLWQIAYAELVFSPKLWPDFRKEDLYSAIIEYQHRERRFGMTSEQIK